MSEGQARNLDILCTNGEEIYQQWDIQFLHKLDTICMSCESDSGQKQNVRIVRSHKKSTASSKRFISRDDFLPC
jgi:hypothetical protein